MYDQIFFEGQSQNSYRSATVFAEQVFRIFRPASVVDLGCGIGTWLKAFGEATELVGIDGPWVKIQDLVDERIKFIPHDLNEPIALDHERFDLAICMETAEHLSEESSSTLVRSLVALSDVVVFSAAYPGQGGTNHINEQIHTYWAKIFRENGYLPYDFFRPVIWGNEAVEFWYQQNAFLFVKTGASVTKDLEQAAVKPIANIEFMNCIHPELYDKYVRSARSGPSARRLLRSLLPPGIVSFARRLRRNFP